MEGRKPTRKKPERIYRQEFRNAGEIALDVLKAHAAKGRRIKPRG